MKGIKIIIASLLLMAMQCTYAQTLKPGFDKAEYRELMLVSVRATNYQGYAQRFDEPGQFRLAYASPVMGLENRWDLWTAGKELAVISIRGTTQKPESWLANFYAAMLPAKGSLNLAGNRVFNYELAADKKAAVHAGWLLSMAFLSADILPRIDSCYRAGIRNILIMGHSQGGAIAYLLTAHLHSLQQQSLLPRDIRFKTYCSASPKPGNLYFAYAYEAQTQGGWAFNVVNTADWVPETPASVQTSNDFNNINPFTDAKKVISKQRFPRNLVMRHIYNRLNKPTQKAQRRYEKYLGRMVAKMIRKKLAGFEPPAYYHSNDYVRTGQTVVLFADSAYYREFPDEPGRIFQHHLHKPYLYLLDKLR